jgi:hypothetical protein
MRYKILMLQAVSLLAASALSFQFSFAPSLAAQNSLHEKSLPAMKQLCSVQGVYGGRTVASAYNPWTGGRAATSQGHNPYAQWGSSVATRNGQAIQTGHVTTAAGTTAGYRTSTGQRGVISTGANGAVAHGSNGTYVGHDGNVYRKDSTGNWSQYNNGNWNHVDTSNAQAQAPPSAGLSKCVATSF